MKKQKCWYLIQTWSDKAFKGTVVNRALPSLYGGLFEICYSPFNIQGLDTISSIRFNKIESLDTVSSIRFNIQGLDTVSSIWLNNEKVGTSNNMFVRYIYPIKELLKPGNHFSFFSYFNFFFVPQIHLSKMLSYFIFHCFYKLLEQNHLLFILNLCWFTNYLLSYNSFFHSHISQTFVI